jgi:UDP-N-acetylglucosamine 2-epimerase (non-hydrolysing)
MKISVILGTRPEAIKLCPVILQLRQNAVSEITVCVTGQHRKMLDQTLKAFGVVPDVDLNVMQPNQTLPDLTSRILTGVSHYLRQARPDLIVVQGDTTTAFAAALAGYYERIPVAHVEAGLRTHNKFSPYPEEVNRTLLADLSRLHFAPTQTAKENLLREGICSDSISVTGNTVIDALLFAVNLTRDCPPQVPGILEALIGETKRRFVLITGHRRENFGAGFVAICRAILCLAERFPEVEFVYPVHLNPNVREPVQRILSGQTNVHLLEPLDYLPFVRALDNCFFVLTDSGGIQEEAPSLGKPVLVMRTNTERPEAITAGTARIVGVDSESIFEEASRLLLDSDAYRAMSLAVNPYGDGKASVRIAEECVSFLERKAAGA